MKHSPRLAVALSHAHPAAIAIVAGWERLALALCKVGPFHQDGGEV
jgi:hypothetical protein